MKFDKNSVIGFVLLAGLFLGYFYFTRVGQLELEEKQKQMSRPEPIPELKSKSKSEPMSSMPEKKPKRSWRDYLAGK